MNTIEIRTHFMDSNCLVASVHLRYPTVPRQGEFIRFKGDVFIVSSVIYLTESGMTEVYCDKRK